MEERIILGHSTGLDPDGERHEWLQYKYKDYIFNKEWYVNMENEYVMGLTLFKLGKKNINRFAPPQIEYEGKYYNEIFHSGNFIDHSEETTGGDDETIEFVEMVVGKYVWNRNRNTKSNYKV